MKLDFRNTVQIVIPMIMLIMMSCKGENSVSISDQEKMEANVRSYFFMGDSVELKVTIADTIYAGELENMLAMLDTNLMLIQEDIDTANSIIDALTYANQEESKKNPPKELDKEMFDDLKRQNPILNYRLKVKELEYKKLGFQQSNRVYLHLKRSIWANIAGYEVDVHYKIDDEEADLKVLMDADFNVVD